MKLLLSLSLYLLALINPISKIFILSAIATQTGEEGLVKISIRSTIIAFLILAIFSFTGNLLLSYVFHVELYAFKVAGGIVVFTVGYKALTKGLFFETSDKDKYIEMSIVPLASPMIAGPGTMTATISITAEYGFLLTISALTIALVLNLIFMIFSENINKILIKNNITGAIIRITGLIVATIGAQLIFDGIRSWLAIL